MSEETVKAYYLDILRPHFAIQPQAQGTHFSGKRLRIDAIIKPHNTSEWKNKDVAFGVEFKDVERFTKEQDTNNFTKWLSQCVDYAHTTWDGYGYLHVLACPKVIGVLLERDLNYAGLLRNFMSQLGVGELHELPWHGLSILMNGHHRIWSQSKGVESGKTYNMTRIFGSK